ncbi:MAG: 2,3-bisphosphoglycerate-independent phosphoglycerate mutase [Gammaproteobacteria bacterium]|nr:2,3-bisphosphoglycerate-independent phosphoglycerate mutase [Gammaproteobacteria bacterium]
MRKVSLLVILDGFGHQEPGPDNAIHLARTPNLDRLLRDHPHTLISGSGLDVGLPDGQMGNSEVGHMHLGAGRVVYQDFTRINRAIEQNELVRNRAIVETFDKLKTNGGALHVMGLLSPGGVHSHEDQIFAALRIAKDAGLSKVYLHAFLDGRDTPPKSAAASLEAAERLFAELGNGQVASICGRYFAMDRDKRWDRQERAYNLLVRGEAPFHADNAVAGLELAYARSETDEFVQPTAIHPAGTIPVRMLDGDAVIFMNFRADRVRQITRAILNPQFDGFQRQSTVRLSNFVMLTRYADDIQTACAFDTPVLRNTLGEYLAELRKTQLRVAETEKYAHVTFFFSGGREEPFAGEDRVLIPSPNVATYDLAPEMSAGAVTDAIVAAVQAGKHDVIIANYANGDMVGHTGVLPAAIKAVEKLDESLGRIMAAVDATGSQMLITADHGNCEQMLDHESGQPHTAHTCEPVPLIYYGSQALTFKSGGSLKDVAPTLLDLMHIEQPEEMNGDSLATIRARQSA